MNNMKKKTTTTARHIVSWSPEEDNILREQIRINGTDNWAVIASKFKDKTTRQCRRRWYTYLNSDFKSGGWSPEEDILLCEAQRIFGNRWTEIAKVVSGRTDNAVKNRFSTLCKKRAKLEALAKENKTTSYINLNNKRVISSQNADQGLPETRVPLKRIRRNHISDSTENVGYGERPQRAYEQNNMQQRYPFSVLVQNFEILSGLSVQNQTNYTKEVPLDDAAGNDMVQGMYLKKDDPKIIALMQQAELLSSLALKVNTENTDESLENAWKILQDFLSQSKEVDMIRIKFSDMDFQLENSKDMVEDLNSSKEGSGPTWRLSDLYVESPNSSEYSTGSTILNHLAVEADVCAIHQNTEAELQPTHIGYSNAVIMPSGDDLIADNGTACAFPSTEFNSPLQVTPLFKSLATGIPSPQFTESERRFLLKALGVESESPNPSKTALRPPPCKKALLQSL